MLQYALRRVALLPVTLICLSIIVFSFMFFISPYARLAVFCNNPEALRTVNLDVLLHRYGLDKPVPAQYWTWLNRLFHADFGWSQSARMPVIQALLRYGTASIELLSLALIWALVGSIILGTYAAVHEQTFSDMLLRVASTVSLAIPEFIFGLVLLVVFYSSVNWFPPGRLSFWALNIVYSQGFITYTGLYTVDSLLNANFWVFLDALRHLFLPSLVVALGMWTTLFRLMRSSLLEVMHEEYVIVARAKGLTEAIVIRKHARRNALLPVITQAGITVVRSIGGIVIVESVFTFRGMGMFLVTAATTLDFPAILGISLVVGAFIILMNIVIDLGYAVLDPRIQYK